MRKNVLLLLAALVMVCVGAGCSEDDMGWRISDGKIMYADGSINYSPKDINELPEFLHHYVDDEREDSDYMTFWHGNYVWTGIFEGKRYYAAHSSIMSTMYGTIFSETGEYFPYYANETGNETWTDVEVIYIHPKYIEFCKKNKVTLMIFVPESK